MKPTVPAPLSSRLLPLLTSLTLLAALALGLSLATGARAAVPGARALASGTPVSTAFTYQGRLHQAGTAYTGPCDLRAELWDAATAGTSLGTAQTLSAVPVTAGRFTLTLNAAGEFGTNAFDGNARWLAIAVRCPSGAGTFTPLTPRQALTGVPYALYALNAGNRAGYYHVLVVAAQGGDFTSIQAALDSVTPSIDERYLVWIAPGIYSETVHMRPYMDVQGASETLTVISAAGTLTDTQATLYGADNAELRDVTVVNTGGAPYALAILNASASPRLTHVTARAGNATTAACAIRHALSEAVLTHVTAAVTGIGTSTNYGLCNDTEALPTLTDLTISVTGGAIGYGLYNERATPAVNQLALTLTNTLTAYGVYNLNSNGFALQNIALTIQDVNQAFGVYNVQSAPTLADLTLDLTAATQATALYTDNAAPRVTNLIATVVATQPGATAFGAYSDHADLVLDAVSLTVNGPGPSGTSYGLYNRDSALTVRTSVISAQQALTTYGLFNTLATTAHSVRLDNSTLSAATHTLHNETNFTTRIGTTQLAGGLLDLPGGTLTCIGVYDEAYQSAGYTTCP